jgi:hypothetical protein
MSRCREPSGTHPRSRCIAPRCSPARLAGPTNTDESSSAVGSARTFSGKSAAGALAGGIVTARGPAGEGTGGTILETNYENCNQSMLQIPAAEPLKTR